MQNGEWNPDWKPVHARHTVHLQEEWKLSTKGRSGHIILILSFAQYAFIIHKNSQYVAGIYIHIPFCRQACHYCNFHFSTTLALQNDFTAALLKEVELRLDYLEGESVETIYIGGGTPSLLADSGIREILESVFTHFSIGPHPEITLEANPDDMHPDRLRSWKSSGINRLSIGVQSFFTEDL